MGGPALVKNTLTWQELFFGGDAWSIAISVSSYEGPVYGQNAAMDVIKPVVLSIEKKLEPLPAMM